MGIKTVTTVTVECDFHGHKGDKKIEQGYDYVEAAEYVASQAVCWNCWRDMTAADLVKYLNLDGIYRETVGRECSRRAIDP